MKRILFLVPLLALAACAGKKDGQGKVLAKIGGEKFTQGDFEFLLKTMPEERRNDILKDSASRRTQFDEFLKRKLQALAGRKALGKNEPLTRRLASLDKRVVTQYYYQYHLGENNGYGLAELEGYYKTHASLFMGDSGKAKPFDKVRPQVADSLALSLAPLDSFYQARSKNYERKPACELSWIKAPRLKTAEAAYQALNGGMAFSAVAEKYSSAAADKKTSGKLGRIGQGESLWDLSGINTDSLFFDEDHPFKPGSYTRPIKKDSFYVILRADSCSPKYLPPLSEVRAQVAQEYLAAFKLALSENGLKTLKGKYGVDFAGRDKPTPAEELKKYYEAHKDGYYSPETYDLYHIESKDNGPTAKKVAAAKSLEAFMALAAKLSENSWTQGSQGRVGVVKRDHVLPYGIGMMPSLFPALDAMEAGPVAAPVQNPDTKKWHYFWLAKKFPKQLKPFDRVKLALDQDYKAEKVGTIKPEDVLARYGKDKSVREDDVIFLRSEIPPNVQERFTREGLLDFLLTWDLATAEAEALGLTKDEKLRAQRTENELNYWSGIYQDSVVNKTAGLDSVTLKKTFQENRSIFTKDTADNDYRKFARDIAAFLTLGPLDFDIEYHSNPDRYRRDTVAMPIQEARFDMFQNLRGVAYARAEQKLLENLKREFQVVVLDPSLRQPKITDPREAYKQAQNLHYDRKLDLALQAYQKLRDEFPRLESLQDSICFGMAQINIEQEKYQQALAEYRRLSYLYPKSANNYKAMFMVGFIYSEHVKNDSAAVRAFEKMLGQYPKTDLSDDADWMIRNIRSGGKLMPVLEGDSGYVAPKE